MELISTNLNTYYPEVVKALKAILNLSGRRRLRPKKPARTISKSARRTARPKAKNSNGSFQSRRMPAICPSSSAGTAAGIWPTY